MKPRTVLIVDPDHDIRDILRAYLESQGYQVLDTASGEEGLGLAGRHDPDVIVADLPMDVPGHSPFVRALREEVGSTAPILVFTARATRAEVAAARKISARVLTKPAFPSTVAGHIRRLLGDDAAAES